MIAFERLINGALRRVGYAGRPAVNPYDMNTNGEMGLLNRLRDCDVRTIFDVGANHGEYSMACAEAFPGAAVHAFEIVPETAALLARSAAGRNVTVNAVGLLDVAGVVPVSVFTGADHLASIRASGATEIHAGIPSQTRELRTIAGDGYCATNGINRIDILKIDAEGAEPKVLAGFHGMLDVAGIGLIQFEYGLTSIYTHFLLRDFYDLLTEAGFQVGKLLPRQVAFRPYSPFDEDFKGPNYVAVHRSRPDLLSAATGY